MSNTPYEIERKYLIRMPDAKVLSQYPDATVSAITQTYLHEKTHPHQRVRARETDGRVVYTHTHKTAVTDVTRVEIEQEITEDAYHAFLSCADANHATIYKIRYAIPFDGLVWEIDIYPFWQNVAILEVELSSEDQVFSLPPFVSVVREVTEEREFSNRQLALWQKGNKPAPVV